jgi:hypothetical protein
MRASVLIVLVLVSLAASFFGLVGWASAGFCDTNCPSDRALTAYKAMCFVGTAVLAVSFAFLLVRLARR